MNKKQFLISFVIIPFIIISCAQAVHEMKSKSVEVKIKYDPLYLTYPKYRIDHLIRKICIIGVGENNDSISARLTEAFMKNISAPIRVVEPGNIESILKGRIIEFETGLTKDESQLLSQMLQIDHIVLFNSKMSPHQDYYYGGRCYAQISLKIISTISGEIVFQTIKQWGAYFPDPRPTFSHINPRPSESFLGTCEYLVGSELLYALGETKTGLQMPKIGSASETSTVGQVMINSPAYKSGIQEGDKVIEIGGVKINSWTDINNYYDNIPPKQGDILKLKIKRAGKILELDVKFPVIPMYPVQKPYEEEEKTGTKI